MTQKLISNVLWDLKQIEVHVFAWEDCVDHLITLPRIANINHEELEVLIEEKSIEIVFLVITENGLVDFFVIRFSCDFLYNFHFFLL